MWHGLRCGRTPGGARHLRRNCLVWCTLGCLGVLDIRAQATGGEPERDRAVALVERLGGQIERDESAPGRPVVGIRLATTRVSDVQLGELRSLISLARLDLTQTKISDDGLARLRGHEGLRSLTLYDTRMADRGFEHVATLTNLEALYVGLCGVTGPGLSRLERLHDLKTLSLIDLEVTDEAIAPLSRLNRLERLDLVELKITDAGLVHLRGLTRLRELKLDANAITDGGLAHLAGLTDLQDLGLEGTRVTDAGLVHLKALPRLKRLRHAGTGITAAGLSQLAHIGRTPAPDVTRRPKTAEPGRAPGDIMAPAGVTSARVRTAVARALPPLQKGLVVYAERRDCFSCHNQGVPLVALSIARSRGLAIDEDAFRATVELTLADLESALERYRRGRGQPGGAIRAAYALWTLEVGNHQPDETTAAVAEFLVKADQGRDHWTTSARREPIEASQFTTTALALRGLRAYAANGRTDVVKHRVENARSWLARSKPADTEDRVFRLWGMKYAAASPEEIKTAAEELLVTQRGDGGWAQIDELSSDSYATGSALVALHEAGSLATDDPAYRRGVAFLVRSQKDDGTWFVASRSQPFQLYFESGFPYGKDQFIAMAASGWATAALALALTPGP
jgi:hypothetical protein